MAKRNFNLHDCVHRDDFIELMKAVERLDATLNEKRISNGASKKELEDDMDRLWELVSGLREDVARLSLWMRINAGLFIAVLMLLLRVSGVG